VSQALKILSQAVEAASRMKVPIAVVALLYAGSFLAGWYLISINSPLAVETKQGILGAILTEAPFTTIIQSLRGGELAMAILTTFLLNLVAGAFVTTTLPGVIPLIGAAISGGVTLLRGFVVGLTYPEVLSMSPVAFALGFGTMILELGAYVFSGAAGIYIAFAPILPRRYGTENRWGAFKSAWRDSIRVYPIVVILLALGAVWEMSILFLLIGPT
jgi:uncharacterized membrane protein SpoIIM required for sporulation